MNKYKTDPKDLQVGDVCFTNFKSGDGGCLKTIAVVCKKSDDAREEPEVQFKDIVIIQGEANLGESWNPVGDDSLIECELLFSVSRLTIEEQAMEKLKELHPEYTL